MADLWDFNCPQYVDFNGPVDEEDNADEWFDMDHESPDVFFTPVVDRKSRGEPKRVLSEVVLSSNNIRLEYSGGKSNAKPKPSIGPSRVLANKDENNPPETRSSTSKKASLSNRVSKYSSKPRRNRVEVGAGESASADNACPDNKKIKPEVLSLPITSGSVIAASSKIAKYTPRRSKFKEVGAGEAVPSVAETIKSPDISRSCSEQSGSCNVDDLDVTVSSTHFVANVKGNKRISTPISRAIPKRQSLGKKVPASSKRSSLTKHRKSVSKASFTKALRRSPRLLLEKLTGGSRSKPSTPVGAAPSTSNNSSQKLRRSWDKPSSSNYQFAASSRLEKTSHGKFVKVDNTSSTRDVRQQLALRRKLAAPVIKSGPAPMKAGMATTNSVKPCTTQGEAVREFASTLRKFSEESVATGPKATLTKPVPFNLSQSKKRKCEESGMFHSLAEQIAAFQTKTPLRFRTRSRIESKSLTSSPEGPKSPKITIAKTPNLVSRYRVRPVTALSQEELERQEIESIQKNQFKANPVNLKAIHPPQLKEVKPKTPTKLEPFRLTCPQRLHSSLHNTPNEKYEFRARPVPAGLFDGPKGLGPCKENPVTIPQTPTFTWKGRLRRRSKSGSDSSESTRPKLIKANPVPHHGVPFKIKLDKKMTTIEPFSFDEMDRERMVKKEEKIKDFIEQENKVKEFHAQPLPNLEPSGIPMKHPRPPTEIQPFNFAYLETSNLRVEKWKREVRAEDKNMEEELRRQKDLASFKAGPNKVIYEEAFIPEKSSKPLTVVSDIELNTERRAQDREEYDEYLKYKESQMEAIRLQREAEAEERERQMIAKMRETAVHKANPVRSYKPLTIQPSNLPLTVPQSPCFITKKTSYTNKTSS